MIKTGDIALLKINTYEPKKFPYLLLGDSNKVQVGDTIVAIGNPFGLSSTFTSGAVSSLSQKLNEVYEYPRIQIDAAINPGNSGGPLLNLYGEVIGVNQMIYSQSGGWSGVGFAIPINAVLSIIDRLKKGEKIQKGVIGVHIVENPPNIVLHRLQIPIDLKGLLIEQVDNSSTAKAAGIKPYDFIISVDGKKADNVYVLENVLAHKKIGESILLRILRNQKEISISVKIGMAN